MWPVQLAFLVLLRVGYSSPPWLITCNFSHDLLHSSPAPNFKTFKAFLIYFSKCPSFGTMQSYTGFFVKYKSNLLVKRVIVIVVGGSSWSSFSNPEISHMWHKIFRLGYVMEWHHWCAVCTVSTVNFHWSGIQGLYMCWIFGCARLSDIHYYHLVALLTLVLQNFGISH
jgi:hypothetical protein